MQPNAISTNLAKLKRVCIVGNSYIGAVKKAYSTKPSGDDDFDLFFFASAGTFFQNINILDGVLVNIYQGDDSSRRIVDYDITVVYGDFPTPRQVFLFANEARENIYSDQLRRARLENWFMKFCSYRLCLSLVELNGPRVFMLSRNYNISETILPQIEYDEGSTIIREHLASVTYVQAPHSLFSSSGQIQEIYYSKSLNVFGEEPDRNEQPKHHHNHLNEAGGRLVLTAILDSITEHVLSGRRAEGIE